jgi:hypothetical protein
MLTASLLLTAAPCKASDGELSRQSLHGLSGMSVAVEKLHGSLDKEGVLEFGLIGRGMRFIFLLNDDRPVTTTRVLHVQVDRLGVVQPASSPSIH